VKHLDPVKHPQKLLIISMIASNAILPVFFCSALPDAV
jgi:hypothetical protein